MKKVVEVSDVCHIYDNSENKPFRIFKKKKDICFFATCEDWYEEDIKLLTGIQNAREMNLN